MKNLNYERIAQLVAVSAINKKNSAITNLEVRKQDFCVKFSDYVKSQIHLNIVEDLYGRKMSDYVKALDFLRGDRCYYKNAERVLSYFYSDMANFLVNNPSNIMLTIKVDAALGSEVSIDFETVKKQLRSILDASSADLAESIKKFEYSFIFDDVDNLEDVREKLDSYTLAAILKAQVQHGMVQRINLEVHNDSES